jgi:hypothetical protein
VWSQKTERGARTVALKVEYGILKLQTLALGTGSERARKVKVTIHGKPVSASLTFEEEKTLIRLDEPAQLRQGDVLTASLR